MSNQRVAYRYAKALIELAEEQKALDKVAADMNLLISVCDSNRDFRLMLNSPVITHDKKLKILQALFGKKSHKITSSYIQIVTRKNRENMLEAAAREYLRLHNLRKGIEEVSVTTAVALDKKQEKEFEQLIKGITGKEVVLDAKVDKNIIGGFVVRINDRQIDESIRTKLKELEYKFGENPYVSKN